MNFLVTCAYGMVGGVVLDDGGEVGVAKGWILFAGARRVRVQSMMSRSGV